MTTINTITLNNGKYTVNFADTSITIGAQRTDARC